MALVNVTTPDSQQAAPASSGIPDTLVGFHVDTTQHGYASPSGTINNVNGGFPRFVGVVRLAVTLASGNATWTGLGEGADNQQLVLWNSDAANTLTLAVKNAGSLAKNQFSGSAGSYALLPGNAILLVYYAAPVSAWVIVP